MDSEAGGQATERFDAVVIGAGFFGVDIALELRRLGLERVLLVDRAAQIMSRASYVNQARVHNGYHYPRSLMTAERARSNFETFLNDFPDCVLTTMESVYAVARGSRVSGSQFATFCRMIDVPCHPAPRRIAALFDGALIEEAFLTREFTFDANKLAARARLALERSGVAVRLNTTAAILESEGEWVRLRLNDTPVQARWAFNCTYADIERAGVRLQTRVKRELTEMVLLKPPPDLRGLGVTVMDGPFFSVMPFPSTGLHSLSHVRYTPHESRTDEGVEALHPRRSNRDPIVRDSQRYLPCLGRAEVMGSVFEIKATLVRNEGDDGRPVLIERSSAMPRVLSVLGAKIDNIYDVRQYLRSRRWDMAA